MKTKNEKKFPLLPFAVGICLISIVAMMLSLSLGQSGQQPQFTPPPFDETAVSGEPEVSESLGWGELDAQAYKVSVCGVVIVDDNEADVWLTNPETNSVWLKLRMLNASGEILGETGLIKPGEYVQSVRVNNEVESGDKVVLKIMAYQPETYYSEGSVVLNTTIKEEDV